MFRIRIYYNADPEGGTPPPKKKSLVTVRIQAAFYNEDPKHEHKMNIIVLFTCTYTCKLILVEEEKCYS